MRDVHTIRLRGPWQIESSKGTVTCRRRFHQPSGLEEGERVLLVVDSRGPPGHVKLNGQAVGTIQAAFERFEITGQLRPFNELNIQFVAPELDIGTIPADDTNTWQLSEFIGEVWLEIGFD
jgi:hypothetical protein